MIFEINPKQTMDHVWITNCTMRREWAQEEKPYEQCLELKWWNLLLFCVSHHYSLLLYALQYICIENDFTSVLFRCGFISFLWNDYRQRTIYTWLPVLIRVVLVQENWDNGYFPFIVFLHFLPDSCLMVNTWYPFPHLFPIKHPFFLSNKHNTCFQSLSWLY